MMAFIAYLITKINEAFDEETEETGGNSTTD